MRREKVAIPILFLFCGGNKLPFNSDSRMWPPYIKRKEKSWRCLSLRIFWPEPGVCYNLNIRTDLNNQLWLVMNHDKSHDYFNHIIADHIKWRNGENKHVNHWMNEWNSKWRRTENDTAAAEDLLDLGLVPNPSRAVHTHYLSINMKVWRPRVCGELLWPHGTHLRQLYLH